MGEGSQEVGHRCCFKAHLVAGGGSDKLDEATQKAIRRVRWLRRMPKVALTAHFIEVENIDTHESAVYVFIGLGLGVGWSFTQPTIPKGKTLPGHPKASGSIDIGASKSVACCDAEDCPTVRDFEGVGRLTIAEFVAAGGANISFIDMANYKDCRPYFEAVVGAAVGAGIELGTYIGYYAVIY